MPHLGMGAGPGWIVASTLTAKDVDDASQAGPLLDQAAGSVAWFTADSAHDQGRVYASGAERRPQAAVVVPPRANAVPNDAAGTAPTQRDGHLQRIAEHGRMAWRNAPGCNKRARLEAAMNRWKQVNGRQVARKALSGWQPLTSHGRFSAMPHAHNPHRGFRYLAEVIQHAVWLYHCFSLSLRDVKTILAARGIVVSYEAIGEWGRRFGRQFANELKRRRLRPGDKWHVDEVFIRIGGRQRHLWRAVDQDGHVLDILVQSRRNTKAAKRFFRKLLRGLQYVPRVIVTDKLKSYAAAKRTILPHVEHRQSKHLNNRAELSHQPTRRQERQVQRFKPVRHAQRFLFAHAHAHARIHNHFQLSRHRLTADQHRAARDAAFRTWREVTAVADAA